MLPKSQPGQTKLALVAEVVAVPVEVLPGEGSLAPCLNQAEVCALIQEQFPSPVPISNARTAALHARLMCTAFFESGFVPTKMYTGNTDKSADCGLFQINSVHWIDGGACKTAWASQTV